MIDAKGYRLNVGIIICNSAKQVLWGKRINQQAWQFPQGGVADEKEDIIAAMLREVDEEVGIAEKHIKVLGKTKNWLSYKIPKKMQRNTQPLCIGQKQKWFLLHFSGDESDINLNNSVKPEFDSWMWVNYWYPLRQVVSFKRSVYRKALVELAPLFFGLESIKGRIGFNNILDC